MLEGVEILLCTIVAHSMSSGASVASNLRLVLVTWLYDSLVVEVWLLVRGLKVVEELPGSTLVALLEVVISGDIFRALLQLILVLGIVIWPGGVLGQGVG